MTHSALYFLKTIDLRKLKKKGLIKLYDQIIHTSYNSYFSFILQYSTICGIVKFGINFDGKKSWLVLR